MNQECAVGYASEADIEAWMDLVALVRDAFPGLSLGEYRGNLRKAIAERRALCAKDARGLLGVLVLDGRLRQALARHQRALKYSRFQPGNKGGKQVARFPERKSKEVA